MKTIFTFCVFSLFYANVLFAQSGDILILGAAADNYIADVKAKLDGTGLFNSVDGMNIISQDPTLAYISGYDAVLVFTDNGPNDATKLGDTLAAYIEAGGGVVNAVFSTASVGIDGKFGTDYQLIISNGNQDDGTRYTLGTVGSPTHAIMQGVSTFDGGSSSYRALAPTLASGTTTLAEWSDGQPLIVVKTGVGPATVNRVDLNFYPPSSDVSGDFWESTTDGAKIMANALRYVGNLSTTATQTAKNVTLSGAYPNPNKGDFTITLNATGSSNTLVKLVNMYGMEVYSTSLDMSNGLNTFNVSTGLPKGIYVLNIAGEKTGMSKIVIE